MVLGCLSTARIRIRTLLCAGSLGTRRRFFQKRNGGRDWYRLWQVPTGIHFRTIRLCCCGGEQRCETATVWNEIVTSGAFLSQLERDEPSVVRFSRQFPDAAFGLMRTYPTSGETL